MHVPDRVLASTCGILDITNCKMLLKREASYQLSKASILGWISNVSRFIKVIAVLALALHQRSKTQEGRTRGQAR